MDNIQKLAIILNNEIMPLSAKKLSKKLNVSDRMIRNYVQRINEDDTYILSNRDGYQLIKYPSFLFEASHNGKVERLLYLFNALTDSVNGANFALIPDELDISLETLKSDYNFLVSLANDLPINFGRINSVYKIEASSTSVNKLYRKILSEIDMLSPWHIDQYNSIFNTVDITIISNILKRGTTKFDIYLNDFALTSLSVHICIAIEQVSIVDNDKEQNMLRDYGNSFGAFVIVEIENSIGFTLPVKEREKLVSTINERVYYTETATDLDIPVANTQDLVFDFVEKTMNKVISLYNVELVDIHSLSHFSQHINGLISRSQNNTYNNPMKDVLRNDYPILFDIAYFFAHEIELTFNVNVNPNEIAFLVLHLGNMIALNSDVSFTPTFRIAVLYPSYYQYGNKLIQTYKEKLSTNVVIDLIEDERDIDDTSYDFILSVVPPLHHHTIQHLIISPLPHDNDIQKLKTISEQFINDFRFNKAISRLFGFKRFIVSSHESGENEEDVIKEIGHHLISLNLVDDTFVYAVLERESIASTCLDGEVALPHSSGIRSKQDFIYVMRSSNQIMWHDESIKDVILFGITNKAEFIEIYNDLVYCLKHLNYDLDLLLKLQKDSLPR